jgi:hypothetical protein
MTTYIAENIETGEIIEGCAKELAKKIGVAAGSIQNAASTKNKVRRTWLISKDGTVSKTLYSIPIGTQEKWDRETAPYKELIANKHKNKPAKIRLRTMYNVGIY